MKELIRTKVDIFKIEDSCKLDDISLNKIITIEEIFKDKEKIVLSNEKLQLFLNGVNLMYSLKDNIYRIYSKEKFIGLGIINNKLLKRDVVI